MKDFAYFDMSALPKLDDDILSDKRLPVLS